MATLKTAPTPAELTNAWVDRYAQALHVAAHDPKIISIEEIEGMFKRRGLARNFADNAADYYAQHTGQQFEIETMLGAARNALKTEASALVGATGRISLAAGKKLSPYFVDDFFALRGKPAPKPGTTPKALAANYEKIAVGLRYLSESDYPYTGFTATLAKGTPLDEASFRAALGVDAATGVSLGDTKDFFSKYASKKSEGESLFPGEAARYLALKKLMRAQLTELSFADVGGNAVQGQVYIFGRAKDGTLTGLASTRVWT